MVVVRSVPAADIAVVIYIMLVSVMVPVVMVVAIMIVVVVVPAVVVIVFVMTVAVPLRDRKRGETQTQQCEGARPEPETKVHQYLLYQKAQHIGRYAEGVGYQRPLLRSLHPQKYIGQRICRESPTRLVTRSRSRYSSSGIAYFLLTPVMSLNAATSITGDFDLRAATCARNCSSALR